MMRPDAGCGRAGFCPKNTCGLKRVCVTYGGRPKDFNGLAARVGATPAVTDFSRTSKSFGQFLPVTKSRFVAAS